MATFVSNTVDSFHPDCGSLSTSHGSLTKALRRSVSRVPATGLASYILTRLLLPLVLLASLSVPVQAQTIVDGIMMPKQNLFTGALYSHDSWDHYWEGTLERTNGNIGTVTTQTVNWYADYGITNRLNVIAEVPYVWTHASQGVLHDMKGFQDIMLAGKYNFLDRPFTKLGSLRAIAVVAGSIPLTDYTPDFLPLSIGPASKRISGRFTLNFQTRRGWFLNGSTAYTWRDKVTLDRPYYYTKGQLFLSNEVAMPDVFDYSTSAGYLKKGLMAMFTFTQQRTQGGGDIRRQDMPFVSNRMNYSNVNGLLMYPLPLLRSLSVQFTYAYMIDGRNVGQSTTLTTGLLYTFNFHRGPTQ
ncbi:MAG: hypothetical protein WBL63_19560 [Candidatus Acidiferrum sp.]